MIGINEGFFGDRVSAYFLFVWPFFPFPRSFFSHPWVVSFFLFLFFLFIFYRRPFIGWCG